MKILKTVKMTAIIIGLFLSFSSLTSCEKVDDNDTITPSNNTEESLLRTEIIYVNPNRWESNKICQEANLNCTILSKGTHYEWLKVYLKVKKDHNQTDIWKELDNGPMGFMVKDSKIYVQRPCNWEAETCVYKVELKLKKNANIKAYSETEIEANNFIIER